MMGAVMAFQLHVRVWQQSVLVGQWDGTRRLPCLLEGEPTHKRNRVPLGNPKIPRRGLLAGVSALSSEAVPARSGAIETAPDSSLGRQSSIWPDEEPRGIPSDLYHHSLLMRWADANSWTPATAPNGIKRSQGCVTSPGQPLCAPQSHRLLAASICKSDPFRGRPATAAAAIVEAVLKLVLGRFWQTCSRKRSRDSCRGAFPVPVGDAGVKIRRSRRQGSRPARWTWTPRA